MLMVGEYREGGADGGHGESLWGPGGAAASALLRA